MSSYLTHRYRLLPGYLAAGNQIESVGANWEGPWAMLERDQTEYGVGCSGDYFVLLTAHPEQGG